MTHAPGRSFFRKRIKQTNEETNLPLYAVLYQYNLILWENNFLTFEISWAPEM